MGIVQDINGLLREFNGKINKQNIERKGISGDRLEDDTIGAAQLAPDSVGSSEIAADAVGASEIATDAVGNPEIAANSILASEIGLLPACRVEHNTTQSLTSGATAPLLFNTETWDTDTMHDPVTNTSRITFTTPGIYIVGCNAEIAANATGQRQLWVTQNGSATRLENVGVPTASGTLPTMLSLSTTIRATASTDYVEFTAFQNAGVALNVVQTDFKQHAWATFVCDPS